ncbi:HAMP domain-containing sensor histidine kinase [Brevibacillus brevis]|uniref:HAMP domain-containing sensor histidine kinase n=1 Tax=Brevibacillus brevis TaxID=1393 RepID=UPI001159ECCD|nr:HAMP domain-containing sensor histidine kinase [Lysinibacillus sp. SDF0063]TQR38843.1 HAMP domain-containing histidine kinase [Lysinibacillus sp. SDF0063]
MKKNESIPDKRPLKQLFFRHYVVISGLFSCVIMVALFGTDLLMDNFFNKTPDLTQVDVSKIYQYPFEKIDGRLLDEYGGWFEIVDESGTVIYVKGNKEDNIMTYSDGMLYAKVDILRNDDSIFYHAYQAQGPEGENYVLLWKFPERSEIISLTFGILIALFVVLLFIALYFYTRYSVLKMKAPLRQIVEGIKEMEGFNYQKRLTFSAEMEFAEIREAFNGMAERLQQTSAEKEAVANNKRNMLLHLSHDLKTPITSVFGYSQLLLDRPELEEEQRRQYVQYINDKSSYMAHLIQNLFELAKLEDQHVRLDQEKVNISKWFMQLVAEFYPEIEDRGFQLEVKIPEEPLFVMFDKMHMNRVITNLIGNSLKHNPPGTQLFVSCEKIETGVVLWLGDNGIGVQKDVREHIFEEFIKGSNPVKDSTGLGLAICKKIITLHQGTIHLERNQRYTTLFKITLPLE